MALKAKDIKHFHFITKDLQLKFITPTTDLCSGNFCDDQANKGTMCACIEKTGVKEWGIRALVECSQLTLERTSHQKSSFISVAFAKLATVDHRSLRPDIWREFQLDDLQEKY